MEPWLSTPPMSVTTPAASANRGVNAGVVMAATSTSPGRKAPKSCGPVRTRAGAVTRPPDPVVPRSTGPSCWARAGIIPSIDRIRALSGRYWGGVASA